MIRQAFLNGLPQLRFLLATSDVAQRWAEPSLLVAMTVGDLAAHAARCATTAASYLAADPDRSDASGGVDMALSAAEYFHSVLNRPSADLDQLNADIVERSVADAAVGPKGVLERFDAASATLADLLGKLANDHVVSVFGGKAMLVDDYLRTRATELVVHADDLASSIGLATPSFSTELYDTVIDTMVGTARLMSNDLDVVRALTRAERTRVGVFPVF